MKNKQGKQTSINKIRNRRHSVTLSEKAEYILRQVCKGRSFNLSRYLSECIVRDFEGDFCHDLNMELIRVSELHAEYQVRMEELVSEIRRVRLLQKDVQE